jgi:ribonuclease P protein component
LTIAEPAGFMRRAEGQERRGARVETNLSTEQDSPEPYPRIPSAHEHQGGACGVEAPTSEGPSPPRGFSAEEVGRLVPERSDERLPRSSRLRKRGEFLAVQEGGYKAQAPHLLALARPNGLGFRRLGVTVSSKVGGAVIRNRVKRRFRELFRRRRDLLPESVDLVLIGRRDAASQSFDAIRDEFDQVARMLRKKLERT